MCGKINITKLLGALTLPHTINILLSDKVYNDNYIVFSTRIYTRSASADLRHCRAPWQHPGCLRCCRRPDADGARRYGNEWDYFHNWNCPAQRGVSNVVAVVWVCWFC